LLKLVFVPDHWAIGIVGNSPSHEWSHSLEELHPHKMA